MSVIFTKPKGAKLFIKTSSLALKIFKSKINLIDYVSTNDKFSLVATIFLIIFSGVEMNKINTINSMRKIAGLILVLAACFGQALFASEHEDACKANIQGKIAWDPTSNYTSASKWDDKNLAYLCKDTKNPKAPGECFHHVMTGHVSYGDGDKWDYQNAIELCKGTSNADEPINCFKGKIADKVDWKTAIQQCQAKPNTENVAK